MNLCKQDGGHIKQHIERLIKLHAQAKKKEVLKPNFSILLSWTQFSTEMHE